MRIRLDARVRVHGRTLVGGEPLRVMRLSPAGVEALQALARDEASPVQQRLGRRLVEAGLAHPYPAPAAADVTIVIPVRDRPAELARCLATTRGATVLVVDDGSRVPVPGALRRDTPGGPAAAAGSGRRASSSTTASAGHGRRTSGASRPGCRLASGAAEVP